MIICQFCQQSCTHVTKDRVGQSYWNNCGRCDVSYFSDNGHSITQIVFLTYLKETVKYKLILDLRLQRSYVYTDGTLVVAIKRVLNGVTPENVSNKVKTLLVFS
jgi:hypothetical protein